MIEKDRYTIIPTTAFAWNVTKSKVFRLYIKAIGTLFRFQIEPYSIAADHFQKEVEILITFFVADVGQLKII